MREHEVNKLDNFIGAWYTDEFALCDKLIDYFNNEADKTPGKVGVAQNANIGVDVDIKDSVDSVLLDPDLFQEYGAVLQRVVDAYIKKYPFCNEYGAWYARERINLQYYKPNGGYKQWHTERTNRYDANCHRHLVFMTYLNDVTDEGETEFFHQKLKIKPEKGLTLIWGSDWTFTHRGIPSPTQEKYIVTGWFEFI